MEQPGRGPAPMRDAGQASTQVVALLTVLYYTLNPAMSFSWCRGLWLQAQNHVAALAIAKGRT